MITMTTLGVSAHWNSEKVGSAQHSALNCFVATLHFAVDSDSPLICFGVAVTNCAARRPSRVACHQDGSLLQVNAL